MLALALALQTWRSAYSVGFAFCHTELASCNRGWDTHSPIFGSKPETQPNVGFCLKFQSQQGVYYPFPQIQHAVKHESESDKLLPQGSCVSWLVDVIKQG